MTERKYDKNKTLYLHYFSRLGYPKTRENERINVLKSYQTCLRRAHFMPCFAVIVGFILKWDVTSVISPYLPMQILSFALFIKTY